MNVQRKLKIVVIIQTNKNKTQITNLVNDIIKPKLITQLQDKFLTDITGLQLEEKVQVTEQTNKIWEVYPRLTIIGDTSLTQSQFEIKIDELLTSLRTTIQADVISFGGVTILGWHIHKSTGTET